MRKSAARWPGVGGNNQERDKEQLPIATNQTTMLDKAANTAGKSELQSIFPGIYVPTQDSAVCRCFGAKLRCYDSRYF